MLKYVKMFSMSLCELQGRVLQEFTCLGRNSESAITVAAKVAINDAGRALRSIRSCRGVNYKDKLHDLQQD